MAGIHIKTKYIESLWGYVFILPALALMTVFWIIPSIGSIYYSFFKYDGIKEPIFIGLQNFIKYFSDPRGLNSLKVAGYYVIGTLPPSLIIGLTIAIILSKKWFRGTSFFGAVFFLPLVIPFIGVTFIWQWIFEPVVGLANYFIKFFGLEGLNWLSTPGLALFCILFISVWKNIGFFVILYLSAIKQIPVMYIEVAKLDGANELQITRHIMWPLLFPTTTFLTIISIIDAFRIFDVVYGLTSGGPNHSTEIIAYYVYQVAFIERRMGYSSAVAVIILIIVGILTYIQWKFYSSRAQFLE